MVEYKHKRNRAKTDMKERVRRLQKQLRREFAVFVVWLRPLNHKLVLGVATVVMLLAQIIPFWQPHLEAQRYNLSEANSLLPRQSSMLAKDLVYDKQQSQYNFNSNYSVTSGSLDNGGAKTYGGSKIKATAHKDPTKGVTVTDPLNQVDFTLTPQFSLMDAKQDGNRIYYPLSDNTGWLVYTMQARQVSEDLVLSHSTSNQLKLNYDLGLGNSLAARMLSDGSVGIYGSDLPINGNVSTSTAKDAALLAKVRQNAKKTKLLFVLPRPVIKQSGINTPDVQAKYILNGSTLTLDVNGLKKGKYPIDIDPSVYVQSAQGLMYGNNETNINFDTTNNLFEKTPVSGGNIRDGVTQTSWSSTTSLPASLWGSGVAISGGYIYVVGGSTGTLTATTASVYWAQLNVNSSTPIGAWTTNTGYNLPVALRHLSLVAYNDYLYAIGGNSGSAVVSTVYKLHLAASGEPTPAWVSLSSTLPAGAGKQYSAATVYQNQLYMLGGQTAATGNTGTTAVYTSPINPDGTIGSWSASAQSLPTALWGMATAIYNGYIYAVGGSVASTVQTAIYYAQISSPGTLSAWRTNSVALSTARYSPGGSFMTIWAGYMYVSGGCSATTATNGYCSTVQSDVQEASINADGSIASWTTLQYYNTGSSSFANISQTRMGYGLVSFGTANDSTSANAGGTLYAVGGCSTIQNASTGACTTAVSTATSAAISSEGDIGPAQTTTSLPSAAGKFSAGIIINNGYIYNVGGCTNNACTNVSASIYYAQINSNGTLGSWGATTASLGTALAAVGVTVLNNTLYTFGGSTGSNESANSYYGTMASNGNISTITADANTKPTAALYRYAFSYVNPATPNQGYVYVMGGCQTSSGIGCSSGTYQSTVYRCPVTAVGGTPSNCVTTSQLQLPTGTGIAAGAQYGNYVYYSSGANSDTSGTAGSWGGQTNLTYYAQIDDSGNVVLPPNKTGTTWPTATGLLADNGVTDTSDVAPGQRRRAAAFTVNGYLYVLGGHDANTGGNGTTLQDMEIGKIDPTTGDIASFTDNYYQITPRWDFKGASANGFIYAVGGCSTGYPPANCTAEDLAVQYMQVYNNYSGSPASYTAASNLIGTPMIGASSAIYNGYIYVVGGASTYGSAPTKTVQYAAINADGSIGSWTTISGGSGGLATARMYHRLVANDGYLYAIGGQSGTANSTALTSIEKASLNPTTGVPSAFAAETNSLTTARSGVDAVYYNGYLYASGGMGTGGTKLNTIEKSLINTSTGALGTWSTTGNGTFTSARMFHSAVAYNGTLYIIGGYDGTNYLGDVQYAQINSNGTIGSFSSTIQLPQAVSQGSAFAANGYLYVLGGRSGTGTAACTNNTYVASISANSTVASGNVPNGLGNWSQTSVTFSGTRYAATASYYGGKAYLIGGSQCASNTVVTSATSTYYGTLQSQPQVAQYSYAIDAINDVFPSKSLFNGIDNGIGASWILDYRSSTDSAAAWGVSTNYGKTTLGTPQAYNPLDASGTNTSFARYYWLELTIDASQAFGYPEDVSRGPTISNLTVQFTANPSQRLRHGKTFINNVQQPLDAPF